MVNFAVGVRALPCAIMRLFQAWKRGKQQRRAYIAGKAGTRWRRRGVNSQVKYYPHDGQGYQQQVHPGRSRAFEWFRVSYI